MVNDKQGKSFDIASSISQQLPFFCCQNIVLDKTHQKDIAKYIYCNDVGISPYKGDYGSQPKKWVDKFFIIKSVLSGIESKEMRKAQANGKTRL